MNIAHIKIVVIQYKSLSNLCIKTLKCYKTGITTQKGISSGVRSLN